MQSSLLLSDTKKFLEKYTRFMTKDIYISFSMNQEFLDQYLYLKDELTKNKYLYQGNLDCKNLFRIYQHCDEMVKLHNQKYLKKAVSLYDDFFDELYSKDILDKNKKMMVLSSEDKMVSVVFRNYIPLAVTKIKYLHDYLHQQLSKIHVILDNYDDFTLLQQELAIYELEDVHVSYLQDEEKICLNKNESVLDQSVLYKELFSFIVKDIFSDKKHFTHFYQVFKNDIYLNRDYKDFDTFKDYHYYMYKRMFLESGLSLRKYNEREIKKRRGHLRTIDDVFVDSKEEVDVGNFLYLNGISYQYDRTKHCFQIKSFQRKDYVIFHDLDISSFDGGIILNRKSKYLEELVCELVKRKYGMERCLDEDIYHMLRDTSMDSYFSEFITNVLIPSFSYYREYGSFEETNFQSNQIKELEEFYQWYLDFKKKHSYLDSFDIHDRIQTKINQSSCDYFITFGNFNFHFNRYFVLLKDYPRLDLLKGNARLFYDYKNYLNEHKFLAVSHSFLSMDELSRLGSNFLKEHLNYLNVQMHKNLEKICIWFYEDENQFKSLINLSSELYSIIENEKDKKICFAFEKKSEVKNILMGNYFVKDRQGILKNNLGKYFCSDIFHIDKKYDVIVLPCLIRDVYHDDYFGITNDYLVKVGLFMSLHQCRDKVYLLCPSSKKDKYLKMFDCLFD